MPLWEPLANGQPPGRDALGQPVRAIAQVLYYCYYYYSYYSYYYYYYYYYHYYDVDCSSSSLIMSLASHAVGIRAPRGHGSDEGGGADEAAVNCYERLKRLSLYS